MKIHSIKIEINKMVATISGDTTRSELIQLFGDPDDMGGFGRKMKQGQILKYGETEFHFVGDKDSDTLLLIYKEQLTIDEYIPEISIKFVKKP